MFSNVLSIVYHQFFALMQNKHSHQCVSPHSFHLSLLTAFYVSVYLRVLWLIVVSTKTSHFHSHRLIEFIFAQFPANTKMLLCKFATVFYIILFYSASKIFRRIADAKLWIVINCNDKQQIVVVTWKSAFVFNELANKNSCIQKRQTF